MRKHAGYSLPWTVLSMAVLIVSVVLGAASSNRQSDVIKTSAGELKLTPYVPWQRNARVCRDCH